MHQRRLEAQLVELRAAGAERLFSEQVSAAAATRRPQLDAALEFVREGDTLIVTKPDRLARSVADLLFLIEGAAKTWGATPRAGWAAGRSVRPAPRP